MKIVPKEGAPPADLTAKAIVHNRSDGDYEIDVGSLSVPALALEVTDAEGSPVALPPPPVPGGEAEVLTLAPDERHVVDYPGFIPAWTPPGHYRVRLNYTFQPEDGSPSAWTGTLTTDWVEFDVIREASP